MCMEIIPSFSNSRPKSLLLPKSSQNQNVLPLLFQIMESMKSSILLSCLLHCKVKHYLMSQYPCKEKLSPKSGDHVQFCTLLLQKHYPEHYCHTQHQNICSISQLFLNFSPYRRKYLKYIDFIILIYKQKV